MSGKKYDYLNDEREKLWAEVVSLKEIQKSVSLRLNELQQGLERKTSDYEKEAKYSSAQVTKYKNKSAQSAKEAEDNSARAGELLATAETLTTKVEDVGTLYESAIQKSQRFQTEYNALTEKKSTLEESISEAENTVAEALSKLEGTSEISEQTENLHTTAESLSTKIRSIHTQSAKKLQELTDTYDEVFGYTSLDEETQEEITTPGKLASLETSYDGLKAHTKEVSDELSKLKEEQLTNFESFRDEQEGDFDSLKKQIRDLLPDAMTAGLSHAYETKRISEVEEGATASLTFKRSIVSLSVISVIPVLVSLYSLLFDNKGIDDVLKNIPQVVLAIIPLYAPAFWFAIAASKRVKLAKRLSEEYAHKEALSKTFEGLSQQISELEESEATRELRVRLLYNIISVSSENPGRLISDYNSSDNPITDVLDRSVALSESLEKLTTVPGFGKIVTKLNQKNAKKVQELEKAVEENIKLSESTPE